MEREIAGGPEEPVPEVAEQPLDVLDPEQLAAQAVIEKSQASDGKKVTFDTAAAFSDDEDEEMEDVAEEPKEEAKEEAKEEPKEEAKEEPKEAKAETKAKWTMKTLPLKKVSTLAKMQAFAKKHSKAIG